VAILSRLQLAGARSIAILSAYFLVVLGVVLSAIAGFRYQEKVLETKVNEELSYLAQAERNYLDLWLQERLKDTGNAAGDPLLIKQFQDLQGGDSRGRDLLRSRLEGLKQVYGYQSIQLLDASGQAVIGTEGDHALAPEEKSVLESMEVGTPPCLVWGLGEAGKTPVLRLSTLSMLVAPGGKGRVGAINFHLDNQALLRLIQKDQPSFYASGEMVLVCPGGDRMTFLSRTRLGDSPMVSVGLERRELVGVQAVLSESGLFEGLDYRGIPSLAASAKLESLPWTVFVKVDRKEVSEPLVRLAWIYLGLGLLVFSGAGILLNAWWGRHRALARLEQNRVQGEKELLDQRLKSLSRHANDIVLLLDARGRILDAIDRALEAYGYSQEQLLSLQVKDLRTLDQRVDFDRQFETVKREQSLRFETEHVRKNGLSFPVEVSSRAFQQGEATLIQSIVRDISERRQAEREREATLKLLRLLNEPNHTHDLIAHLTGFLQDWSGCEAVGIRLREGEDFPYFETRGFPAEFVRCESQLCARDPQGQILRDGSGNPVLECMCGNILCGRFDPGKPFFTVRGSFWTNGTTELLASTTEADRQARTRNRCNGEGYESVALIPLRSGETTLGLLQLNDHASGRFTPQIIEFLERAGDQIGLALAQRQAQRELRESEVRLNRILEATRVGTWEWNIQTGRVRFNERWAGMLGYTLEELEPLSYQTWVDLLHPEDREEAEHAIQRHLARETPYLDLVIRMKHKDGRWVWIHDRGQVSSWDPAGQPLIMYGTHSDITDRKLAEQERLESEYRYASLFASLQEGFSLHEILQDDSGRPVDYRFLDVNPAFEAITHLPRERWIGHTVKEILPGTEAYWIETYGQVALSGEPIQFENYSADLDRWYQVYAFSPERGQFAVLSMEITERKKAEEQIQRMNEELELRVQERTAQLEAANQELEAFSYSVSHDLKAPLRGIDGFSLALMEDYGDQLDAPARHYLARVRSGAQRMGQIIEDLLKLSRVNRGEMECMTIDLSFTIGRILEEFRHRDPERTVELVIQSGLMDSADPRMMNLALENLLGNAWKFTSKTPAARIEWGVESRDGESVYFIRDNGAGFDMAYADKLFSAFQRLHSSQDFEGTGIGLAIVQRIIHRHGGRIWAESEPGNGATFYFVLNN